MVGRKAGMRAGRYLACDEPVGRVLPARRVGSGRAVEAER
ncbi:hypothetical protein JD76_04838 [Micromonospora endolithica]|nr:hypothetical protein JD76_04838 [Micromonospora endolithica]